MPQAPPPCLDAVPVSCYSGSFRTWGFENDTIPDLETSEADDELISEHSEHCKSSAEHFFIGQSPEIRKQHDSEDRKFADWSVQTEVTLSLNDSDIKFFVGERRSDESEMSSLERAIIAQQHDRLPAPVEQEWETDSSGSENEVSVNGVND